MEIVVSDPISEVAKRKGGTGRAQAATYTTKSHTKI